jgi:hypothetical protein
MDNDLGAAFAKLDQLLAVAQEAGPSIALLMEAGRQQGIADQTLQKYLRLNTTVLRWALRLAPDAAADRAELTDAGALLIDWARR